MEENILPSSLPLQIDTGNTPYLYNAAKWAKFLAIMGFIFCALMLIFALFASTLLSTYLNQMDANTPGISSFPVTGGILATVYIVMALVYFLPCLFLYNFGAKMQNALKYNDQIHLNTSFKNLKSFFKFWGILLIIIICIYALTITLAVVMGLTFNT
jgi:uncharacterized membrane protein YjgN (DUF898 family)